MQLAEVKIKKLQLWFFRIKSENSSFKTTSTRFLDEKDVLKSVLVSVCRRVILQNMKSRIIINSILNLQDIKFCGIQVSKNSSWFLTNTWKIGKNSRKIVEGVFNQSQGNKETVTDLLTYFQNCNTIRPRGGYTLRQYWASVGVNIKGYGFP